MDVIGGIKHMENGPRGRKPDRRKGKSVKNDTHDDGVNEKNAPAAADHSSTECDTRLGRTVDTTA